MEFIDLKLEDNEFRDIQAIVYKAAGINLLDSKKALVISRLTRRLRELKLVSFQPYVRRLTSDPDEISLMINLITTNLTRFYREHHQFKILRERILPLILEHKKENREKVFRIWSAGCSTGEEVYTILFEMFNALNTSREPGHISIPFDFKILGSDIDTNVLKKAQSGEYTVEELDGVSPAVMQAYFEQVPPDRYRIKEQIKRYVGFRRINLVKDNFQFKHKIDIIFCRNVVIYFNGDTRQNLYRKFHPVLNDPGFFFSGHSENLFKYSHAYRFVEKSIYRKVEM